MNARMRNLVSLATLAAATPALAQTAVPAAGSRTQNASIPDFSGIWWHLSLPGLEPPASGPGPVTNRSRANVRQQKGISNYNQLVGDYTNPILTAQSAQTVKKFGEISLSGITFPSPANQCWPEPVPYIYKNFAMQIFQHPDRLTIIYEQDHEVRHVRMNEPHPTHVKPSWYGDSVGHYEGDALVIDTVGIKADRPFAMVDMFGTPFSAAMHVVELYRLVDYQVAKQALDRAVGHNVRIPEVGVDDNYRGKYLQLALRIEDTGVFTTPWSASITYGRLSTPWEEHACSENPHEYYPNGDPNVPVAGKPDF